MYNQESQFLKSMFTIFCKNRKRNFSSGKCKEGLGVRRGWVLGINHNDRASGLCHEGNMEGSKITKNCATYCLDGS